VSVSADGGAGRRHRSGGDAHGDCDFAT